MIELDPIYLPERAGSRTPQPASGTLSPSQSGAPHPRGSWGCRTRCSPPLGSALTSQPLSLSILGPTSLPPLRRAGSFLPKEENASSGLGSLVPAAFLPALQEALPHRLLTPQTPPKRHPKHRGHDRARELTRAAASVPLLSLRATVTWEKKARRA